MRGEYAGDRISNLPCSIMDQIFEYLCLRDAVRTSALSREWTFKWVTIPHLVFDQTFQKLLNGKYDIEPIIDRTLVLHKGAITKFSLKDSNIKSDAAINRWLFFLSNHHSHCIEDLALSFPDSDIRNRIPTHATPIHLFAFDNLTHMYMKNGEIILPHPFSGFGRLVRLELVNVYMVLDELKMLLSKSPMLEYLNVQVSEIDGKVKGYQKVLNQHLTVLKLDEVNFRCLDHLNCVLSLFRSSPNLQTTEISCDNSFYDEKSALKCLKSEPPLPLEHLEDVKIYDMSGYGVEMEFLKNLLQWATALKKLKMKSCFDGETEEPAGCKMLRKLAKLPRSSSKAEVVFKAKWNL